MAVYMANNTRSGTRLTDAKLRNLQAGSDALTHAAVSGLLIIPSKNTKGVGSWYIRFYNPTNKSQRVKMKIGDYPAMGLSEAEDEAKRLLSFVAMGQDPRKVVERENNQVKQVLNNTFEALLNQFYTRQKDAGVWKNSRYTEQWIREMNNHVIPLIGTMPIVDIKAVHIVQVLDNIWHATPDTAGKILDRIQQVFTYSEALGYCDHNPCPAAKVALGKQRKKPKTERRMPAMPWQDIPQFVSEVLLKGRNGQAKKALLFLILNAARSGAIRNLTFSEIDSNRQIWTMKADSAERKTNVDRFYPLSTQSIGLLTQQKEYAINDLVFPSSKPNKSGSYVLSDMTLTSILRKNAQEFESDIVGRIPTAHGFRTAFKGWATANGYDDKWSEIQLAHDVGNAVQQAYDREQLIEHRRNMMQEWATYVYPNNIFN